MGTSSNDARSLRRLSLTNCSHCVGHDVNLLKFRKFQLLFFECSQVVDGLIDAGSNTIYINISLPASTACVLRIENHEWDAFLLTPKGIFMAFRENRLFRHLGGLHAAHTGLVSLGESAKVAKSKQYTE